jgi:hypothetical protein
MVTIFDSNVLNSICLQIDDPKTLLNFSLVSKKVQNIVKLNTNYLMDKFAIKHVEEFDDACDHYDIIKYILPNGKIHGIYNIFCSYYAIGDNYRMYYNGILLAGWYWDAGIEGGDACNIEHYKCDCTKDFKNSYTNERINLNKLELKSTKIRTQDWNKCKTCKNSITYEEETWSNFKNTNMIDFKSVMEDIEEIFHVD